MGLGRTWIVAIPALAAVLGACRQERKPGAIGERLAAPTGLYVLGTSATPILLVSNANFRLEFATGSLLALDIAQVDETKRLNLAEGVARSAVPLPNFSGPIALAPDGTTALVTNRFTEGDVRTAPDRLFFVDVGNPDALALQQVHPGISDTSGAITVGEDPYGIITVRLPALGPGRPPRDVAFVANETEGSISVVNLTPGTSCDNGVPSPCEQDALPPPHASQPVFASAGTAADLVFDGPGITPLITRDQHWIVSFVEGNGVCATPADPAVPAGYWRVEGSASGLLTHHACTGVTFADPQISFTVSRPVDSLGNAVGQPPRNGDNYTFDTFAGDFDSASRIPLGQFVVGGTVSGIGVGQILYDPFRQRLYATSRRTNFVYVIDALTYRFRGAWQLSSNVGGVDSRGLALSPDGSELYVVNRGPESLLVLDPDSFGNAFETRLVPAGVVASVALSSQPAEIVLTPDGRYAFISAFNASVIDVVDLRERRLLRSIPTGHGPYTVRLRADGLRAYVVTYFGPAVDIIDTDPLSATFGTVLTTIADSDYVPEF